MDKDNTKPGQEPLRARQETFCQIFAKGDVSASEAYRQAGYSPIRADTNSSNLMVKQGIKDRIAHLRAQTAEKHEVTRETLAQEYEEAIELGKGYGHTSAIVSAITGKARLYGLDKQTIATDDSNTKPLTASEQDQAREWAQFKLWKANRRIGQSGPHTGTNASQQATQEPEQGSKAG